MGKMVIGMWAVAALASAQSVAAQEPATATPAPESYRNLQACRIISEDQERLRCYDRSVSALEQARDGKKILVVDQEQIKKVRRNAFGLNLPSLKGLFGDGDNSDAPEDLSIVTTVKSAKQDPYGKWILILEESGRWVQSDTRELARYPKVGSKIAIRRAAMGSYLANIDGQVAIRVRREQ